MNFTILGVALVLERKRIRVQIFGVSEFIKISILMTGQGLSQGITFDIANTLEFYTTLNPLNTE